MIYTVTTNPNIDYYMDLRAPLRVGGINRSGRELLAPGGKGINVSLMLQTLGKPSCGSVFRNPGSRSVGQLIDSCGLKGYSVGGACVSDMHANFIVNDGGARAADVIAVMSRVHDTVLDKYGIDLVPEVKCLGFGA